MKFGCVILALLAGFFAVQAQQFAIGVKGGIRATDDASGFSLRSSESKRYIVGPAVELNLPWRLGVEVDALYRPFGYTSEFSSCCAWSIIRERSNSWEFPVIGKLRLHGGPLHPFVGVGYNPRIVHGERVSSGYYLSGMTTDPPASIYTYYFDKHTATNYQATHGVVATGGFGLDAGPVRLSPELRYVHWNKPFLDEAGSDGSYFIQSAQNEVFLLIGISWRRD